MAGSNSRLIQRWPTGWNVRYLLRGRLLRRQQTPSGCGVAGPGLPGSMFWLTMLLALLLESRSWRDQLSTSFHNELGLKNFGWEPAQVSVCYPGYPRASDNESETAFRYRARRDAAHVDGLIPEGADRRRHLREIHGFVLGIPMVETSADASPLVVWNGSHNIIRAAFAELFEGLPSEAWGDVDATEVYQSTRRRIFEICERVAVTARPGEAYLIHRLALHGVAPWADGAEAGADGRMIVYFRPEVGGPQDWLNAP